MNFSQLVNVINIVSVTVIATGKRDKEKVYQDAGKRI